MKKLLCKISALAVLIIVGSATSALACNGSLTDDSPTCNGYDSNEHTNRFYCERYGRMYDIGKSCGQYGYQTPGRNRIQMATCEARDYAGRAYRVQGNARQAKKLQNQALQYCHSQSASPRSCRVTSCY